MKWFGENWGAKLCEEGEHVETPVGKCCTLCNQAVVDGDDGIVVPCVRETVTLEPTHRVCLARAIFGGDPVIT